MARPIPGIHLKNLPEKVFEVILEKKFAETKKRKRNVNMNQVVIMLLVEAYCKEK